MIKQSELLGVSFYLPFSATEISVIKQTNRGSIIEAIDARGSTPEYRYYFEDCPKTYVGGWRDNNRFHIHRVTNDKKGFGELVKLSEVYRTFERRVAEIGVATLTTNCKLFLVPIATKRFGFTSSYLPFDVSRGFGLLEKFPFTVSLQKDLPEN